MQTDVAVIGRLNLFEGEMLSIDTPYGQAQAVLSEVAGQRTLAISRHGTKHLPPHKIDYRAVISAAAGYGARRVISINTVGSMQHPVGSFVIPSDFVEFTKSRKNTFFEDRAVHVDLNLPYCPQVRNALAEGVRSSGRAPFDGTYICTEGPHLESPAQIRMLRQFGDVVGMTGYPEVVLAREMCLCYASLCVVVNMACGVGLGPVSAREVAEASERSQSLLERIIPASIAALPHERACCCRDALVGAEI